MSVVSLFQDSSIPSVDIFRGVSNALNTIEVDGDLFGFIIFFVTIILDHCYNAALYIVLKTALIDSKGLLAMLK